MAKSKKAIEESTDVYIGEPLFHTLNQITTKKKLELEELTALYEIKGNLKGNRMTESELIKEIAKMTPDQLAARQKIIEGNIRLVYAIANDYMKKGIEYLDHDELIEVGLISLVKAVDKFDIKNTPKAFSTFIGKCIENEFLQLIKAYSAQKRSNYETISFSKKIAEKRHGGYLLAEEMIKIQEPYTYEEEVVKFIEQQVNSKFINNIITTNLTVEEQQFLGKRFRLNETGETINRTQQEVAEETGISISTVRQKEKKILTKLRNPNIITELKKYAI